MIVVAACSLAGVGEAASQTKHLTGVVRDEAGNPVPGVSVKIIDSWQYVIKPTANSLLAVSVIKTRYCR